MFCGIPYEYFPPSPSPQKSFLSFTSPLLLSGKKSVGNRSLFLQRGREEQHQTLFLTAHNNCVLGVIRRCGIIHTIATSAVHDYLTTTINTTTATSLPNTSKKKKPLHPFSSTPRCKYNALNLSLSAIYTYITN